MALPTITLRVAPEHHQLIRDIGAALRTRPELANVLRDVLQAQHDSGVTDRDTNVLQSTLAPVLDRIAALEEREPRMVRMEALEARIATLEERASMPVTRQTPRPAAAGKRRSPKGVTGEPPP
jgi:hypothetical protein